MAAYQLKEPHGMGYSVYSLAGVFLVQGQNKDRLLL